ncbi:hypothetical protein ACNSPG_03895 [Brucella pituitosa]|uniref:hypothetical protein n=1 Tax=Brucella pituitosa TaxID=571256 RepID=UPI003C78D306
MTETFIVPIDIPAEKTSTREWLAKKMEGATITKLPTKPEPIPKPYKPRQRYAAVNDNHQAIPLCEALIRDKRPDDAALVRRYMALVDVAGLPETDSRPVLGEGGMEVDRRISFNASGDEKDHGVRTTVARATVGEKVSAASDDGQHPARSPAHAPRGEDNIIAHIDAKAFLGPIRATMGPLLDVFEDALFDRRTLTEIGEKRGFKGKQASAAGKAILYMSIDTLRDVWNREGRLAEIRATHAQAKVGKDNADKHAADIRFFGRDITKRPGTIYGRSKAA